MMDTAFIEPVLNRLVVENNPCVYIEATKLLIAYGSPEIHQRILEARIKNPQLKEEWEGKV